VLGPGSNRFMEKSIRNPATRRVLGAPRSRAAVEITVPHESTGSFCSAFFPLSTTRRVSNVRVRHSTLQPIGIPLLRAHVPVILDCCYIIVSFAKIGNFFHRPVDIRYRSTHVRRIKWWIVSALVHNDCGILLLSVL